MPELEGGLRQRILAFVRTVAPFAYCDACLALRVGTSLSEMIAALTELRDDAVLERRRRACYGCGRTLEISSVPDGASPGA